MVMSVLTVTIVVLVTLALVSLKIHGDRHTRSRKPSSAPIFKTPTYKASNNKTSVSKTRKTKISTHVTKLTSEIGSNDWVTFGNDNQRTGLSTDISFTPSNIATLKLKWIKDFTPGVTVLPTDPNYKTTVLAQPVVALNYNINNVLHEAVSYYGDHLGVFRAVDVSTGAIIWTSSLGYMSKTCVNFPRGYSGISSTAVLDRTRNIVYALGGLGSLYALDMRTGISVWTLPNLYDSTLLTSYGGLLLMNDYIYIALGSLCDVGNYVGKVIKVSIDNPTGISNTFLPISGDITAPVESVCPDLNPAIGGGMWGTGGVSSGNVSSLPHGGPDASLLFVATGNSLTCGYPEDYQYSEKMLALDAVDLTVKSQLTNSSILAITDDDFGATSVYINFGKSASISTCSTPLTVAYRKDGRLYVLNAATHATIQIIQVTVPTWCGDYVGSPAWDNDSQVLVTVVPGTSTGTFNQVGLAALKLQPDCTFKMKWNTAIPGVIDASCDNTFGNPTITGPADNKLVFVSVGQYNSLNAIDLQTGELKLQLTLPGPSYSTPSIVGGYVILNGWGGGFGTAVYTLNGR